MKQNNVRRYICFMLIGVVLNLGLYQIAHIFHLPLWMDSIGSAYVAIMLEPAAGLLVAFATNFYQAALIYGSSSLVYYATSAMAALCIGILIRKNGIICRKRYIKAIACYFVCATIIATLLTLWRTNGIADSAWERYFIAMAMDAGVPSAIACLFGTAVLKFFDSLLMLIVLPILQTITPKKYQNYELKQIVSWKHSNPKKED